jgi:hypothetical protein
MMNNVMRHYNFTDQKEVISKVVNMYQNGMSISQISNDIGKSRTTISLYLKHSNIRTRAKPPRKTTLNVKFFDKIDDHIKAYWLGFLLADGSLYPRYLSLELQARDVEHIKLLLTDMNSDTKISKRIQISKSTGKEHISFHVRICSTHLVHSLNQAGWYEFKKLGGTRIVESVDAEFRPSLIRGLFDGDGGIGTGLSYTDAFKSTVIWFRDSLLDVIGSEAHSSITDHRFRKKPANAFSVSFYKKDFIASIGKYMYDAPGPFMERKKSALLSYSVDRRFTSKFEKQCTKCKRVLSRTNDHFYSNKASHDGFAQTCRLCSREADRLRYLKRKSKAR